MDILSNTIIRVKYKSNIQWSAEAQDGYIIENSNGNFTLDDLNEYEISPLAILNEITVKVIFNEGIIGIRVNRIMYRNDTELKFPYGTEIYWDCEVEEGYSCVVRSGTLTLIDSTLIYEISPRSDKEQVNITIEINKGIDYIILNDITYNSNTTIKVDYNEEINYSVYAKENYTISGTSELSFETYSFIANDLINGYTISPIAYKKQGVFIFRQNSLQLNPKIYYTLYELDDYNFTDHSLSLGVVVKTENSRFLITNKYYDGQSWIGIDDTLTTQNIPGCGTMISTNDLSKLEYKGLDNTIAIYNYLRTFQSQYNLVEISIACRAYRDVLLSATGTYNAGYVGLQPYLPSIGELYDLYLNKTEVIKCFEKINMTFFDKEEHWEYLSSTQGSYGVNVNKINLTTGNILQTSKYFENVSPTNTRMYSIPFYNFS